jgi:hypothetical protein
MRHVAHKRDEECMPKILVGKCAGKRRLDIDGRIILKLTFNKFGGMVWTRFILAQDKYQWMVFMNVIINVSDKREESF